MIFVFERFLRNLSKWFTLIGGVALLALTAIACINMAFRPLGYPLKGAYELVGFLGAMVVALPLAYTQLSRSHISVDILLPYYSKRTKKIINAINSFLCTIFFITVTWQSTQYATTIWKRGETSETLRIIYYPFVYVLAICSLLLSLILLFDFIRTITSNKGEIQ
jgi:TRAP-type C4-dicarboxylate transport system permease small subunit